MTRQESKHVAYVSMIIDIPINCCVRLLHLVPILLCLTLRDGKHKVYYYVHNYICTL